MLDYTKNILIGLFIIIACGIFVAIVLFLEPTVGDGKQTLVVRFSNINGINVGTRVMFAGNPVGEVVKIEQIPDARAQPTDQLGDIYFYQLIIHVDSSVRVYNTDEVTVQTSGLLGEKSIAIIPKAPPKGVTPKRITAKTPVYADSIDPLENALNEISVVADRIEDAVDQVIIWIDENGDALGSAIRSFDSAMQETSIAIESLNSLHILEDVKLATQNFNYTLEDIQDIMAYLNDENVFNNAAITMRHVKNASRSLDITLRDIADGSGSLGKFIKEDGFYLRINSMISKLNTIFNDVNHYGFFFNMNKEWQRTRLKQISWLNSLQTPQEFKQYFEKEIDQINTSMGRISTLINKADTSPDKEKIFESTPFKKDFYELYQSVEALSDSIKLYNEQLTEAEIE